MTQRLHLLHVVDSLAPGGAERMVVEIANATDLERYRVSVCVTRAGANLSLRPSLSQGVGFYVLPRRFRYDLPAFKAFAELCHREEVDLLHVHNRPSFRFIAMCKVLGCLPPVPTIFLDQFGDVEVEERLPTDLRWMLRWVRPYFVGVDPDLATAAQRGGVPSWKATVVSNAIDFGPFEEARPASVDATSVQGPIGILVANVRPQKDYETLLQALAQVKERPWHLLAVGGFNDAAYHRSCLDLVQVLGLEGRVSFLGPRLDVPSLLKAVDFAVLSSRSESGPLVLLEYAAAGLPFVSTRVGLIGGSLADMGAPEFVPPGDADALAAALRRLLDLTPAERRARGQRTRDLAAARFDIRNVMPQWYHVYKRALERGPL
ncbi:MAG: glycosyltransferase [Candidatus Zipacnadales bacterium]